MNTVPTRKSIAMLLLVSASLLPIAGCETIQRETGWSKSTTTGVVSGASAGGIIALLADANPAWVAASVVLGGVAGGAIGNALGKDDAKKHASTNLHALDTLAEGQTESWHNSKTGHSGSTTVRRVTRKSDGIVCKSYTEVVHAGSDTVTRDGTACRGPGGTWKSTSA
jgi:surface antigen